MDLARKLGTAFLALLVAVVLWGVVNNLDRSSAVFRVPITYEHPQHVVTLDGHPGEVELRVLATKPKLRTLTASDFDVRVRNPQGRTGRDLVFLDPSDVDAPFGVNVQEVVPSQLTVEYDEQVSRLVPVEVAVVGQPAPGYEAATRTATAVPAQVRVSGPATRLRPDLTIATEPVDVSGAASAVGPARVALIAPPRGLAIEGPTHVSAAVPVEPRRGERVLEAIPVQVVRGTWQTSAPNPRTLRVALSGPEPALIALEPSDVTLRVDVTGLAPRTEDYFWEVEAIVDPAACPGCTVTSLAQNKVHVNVKDRALTPPEPAGQAPAEEIHAPAEATTPAGAEADDGARSGSAEPSPGASGRLRSG